MPIRFACPACLTTLQIARRKSGLIVNCPKCAAKVRVPKDEQTILDGILVTDAPSAHDEAPQIEPEDSIVSSTVPRMPVPVSEPSPRKIPPIFIVVFLIIMTIAAAINLVGENISSKTREDVAIIRNESNGSNLEKNVRIGNTVMLIILVVGVAAASVLLLGAKTREKQSN